MRLAIRNRNFLGAEELIELGQAQPAVAAESRVVFLSPNEGMLLVRVLENIVSFAESFPIEFQSYCPVERWQTALTRVGTWVHEIERQVQGGSKQIQAPADAVLHLIDIEKCVSAARDARLSSAKLAFGFTAGGAIADFLFGWRWVALAGYLSGLAVLFGRPLIAKFRAEPQEPFKPVLGAGCKPDPGTAAKKTVLERVILSRNPEAHYWGSVQPKGSKESAVCLVKDRYRIRIEGWTEDRVIAKPEWGKAPLGKCTGDVEISVWETCGSRPRATEFGPVREKSGMTDTYWVDYVGPLTEGRCRTAGPFG